jgi:3-oxoacyl-[acyl-carrier protein] reductase
LTKQHSDGEGRSRTQVSVGESKEPNQSKDKDMTPAQKGQNMTSLELTGRIALVTGSSRGIGRAIAIALAKAGADVAVNYLTHSDEAEKVCAGIRDYGRSSMAISADVSIASEASRLVKTAEDSLGPISILVNNAGIAKPQSLEAITEQSWDETLTVNLKSCFLVTQAALPAMRKQRWGRIINLSSGAAQIGGIVGPHYAASKAGILGLTRSYASLLVREGITVNAIAPALISTEMLSNNPKARPDLIPLGRFGTVEEVAEVAVMLACNGYITGQTIHVNGGLYTN